MKRYQPFRALVGLLLSRQDATWETGQRVRLLRQWEDDVDGTIVDVRPDWLVIQFDDENYRRTMDYAYAEKRLRKITSYRHLFGDDQ